MQYFQEFMPLAVLDVKESLRTTALQHQSCIFIINPLSSSNRYGWIAEGVAVVPRLTPDMKCGNNQTGVVEWRAKEDKQFGAFCSGAVLI